MKRVRGKREIEAVCDSWENGIVGYLYHKLSQELEVAGDTDEISFMELQDDTMDEVDMGIGLENSLDDTDLCVHFSNEGDDEMYFADGDDEIYFADGDEKHRDIYFSESDEDSEIGFQSMQDDLFNI